MAIHFDDASSQYLAGGDDGFLVGLTEWSVAATVNLDAYGTTDKVIVEKAGSFSTSGDFTFYFDQSGSGGTDHWDFLAAHNGAFKRTSDAASNTANAGSWDYVTASFKINSATGCKLHYNGTHVTPVSTTSLGTGTFGDNANNLVIGARSDGASRYMDGSIGYVAFWDIELTDAESDMLTVLHLHPRLVRPNNLIALRELWTPAHMGDVLGAGATMTATNSPTSAPHPRIIMPGSQAIMIPPVAAAGLNIPNFYHHRFHNRAA